VTTPETTDLAGTAIDRLTPYLPELSTHDPQPSGDSAVRPLYDAVAGRLRALGETEALAEFVQQPRNNSLVRRLLATAVEDDPEYAAELAAAIAATPATPAGPAATRDGSPTGVLAATARRPSTRVLLIGSAALILAVAVIFLVARNILADLNNSGGLTSASSCAEFLHAPREDRLRAIEAIALAKDVPELGSPVLLPAITEVCDTQPNSQLGDVVAKFGK
jgi:hypothetical protein